MIENTTNGSACYAIDTLYYSTAVSITVNGGTVKSNRIAIRQVVYSATAMNTLNINGGTITGGSAAAQTHNFSKSAGLADVNITGGVLNGTYAYYTSYSYADGHAGTDVEITGGEFNGDIYIYNGQAGSNTTDFANVSISNGNFNGEVFVYTKDADKNIVEIPAITGGVYAYDENAYCAEGFHTALNAEGKYVAGAHSYEVVVTDPTCTTDGYTTHTCICGDSFVTDVIVAQGHSLKIVSDMVRPTCTEEGWTIGLACNCGFEIVPEVIKALGHTYDNNTDIDCNVCGAVRALDDYNLKFAMAPALSFQDYIGIQIFFKNSVGQNYDRVYATVLQADPAGAVSSEMGQWGYGASYTVFEHQVMAWSMTEKITITLYGEKDGIVYKGETIETSVEALALTKIAEYEGKENIAACTALVDMLNYGAAVQLSEDHNVNSVPNAGEYAKYATATEPEFDAANSITGEGLQASVNNVSMQAKVEIQLMFKTTDVEGKTLKATFDGKEAAVEYTVYGSYTICRVAVGAAYMRDTFTIALYDAEGNAASAVYEVSVEAYGQAQLGGNKADLVKAMMKYGDAVAALGQV